MPRPCKDSPDLKDERDEALVQEYYRIMASYGETAKYMAKSFFYKEAAKKFYITPGAATNIITKCIKNKSKAVNVGS